MELRRRTTRKRQQRNVLTARAQLIGALVVFLALAGFIGFSKWGTRAAREIVAPTIARFRMRQSERNAHMDATEKTPAVTETPLPAATETIESSRVLAPAYTLYALQIGSFENEENAKQQAHSLKAIGAAGYILPDNGRYRVLAAGYNSRADCESVQTRLSAQGVDSLQVTLTYEARSFMLDATNGAKGIVETSLNKAAALPDDAYETCIAFDRDTDTLDESVSRVQSIRNDANRAASELQAYGETGGLGELTRYYEQAAALCENTLEERDDAAAFSVSLKLLYLELARSYGLFLTGGDAKD